MIKHFTRGMDFKSFREDLKTVAAVVERKLLIISEAAIRLGDGAATVCPDQPWHKIRGIGNWIRHQYEQVDLESIWGTVRYDLSFTQGFSGTGAARRMTSSQIRLA